MRRDEHLRLRSHVADQDIWIPAGSRSHGNVFDHDERIRHSGVCRECTLVKDPRDSRMIERSQVSRCLVPKNMSPRTLYRCHHDLESAGCNTTRLRPGPIANDLRRNNRGLTGKEDLVHQASAAPSVVQWLAAQHLHPN